MALFVAGAPPSDAPGAGGGPSTSAPTLAPPLDLWACLDGDSKNGSAAAAAAATAVEPLPTCRGFVARDLLSEAECARIVAACERAGFAALPASSLAAQRTNTRLQTRDARLAAELFRRVAPLLPPALETDARDAVHDATPPGRRAPAGRQRWRLARANEAVRVCRYAPGQFFGRHVDGHVELPDPGGAALPAQRSFFTLMVYLNAVEAAAGGATRFYAQDAAARALVVDHRHQPRRGDCMALDQEKLHDGEPLLAGAKYLLRTEALYALESAGASVAEGGRAEARARSAAPLSGPAAGGEGP